MLADIEHHMKYIIQPCCALLENSGHIKTALWLLVEIDITCVCFDENLTFSITDNIVFMAELLIW